MRLTDVVQKTKRKCLHDCVVVFKFPVQAARRAARLAVRRAVRAVRQVAQAPFRPAPADLVAHPHHRQQERQAHAAVSVFTHGMDLCG